MSFFLQKFSERTCIQINILQGCLTHEKISGLERSGWYRSKSFKQSFIFHIFVSIRQILWVMYRILAFKKLNDKNLGLVVEISLMYNKPFAWWTQVSWFMTFFILLLLKVDKTVSILACSICSSMILSMLAMITHIFLWNILFLIISYIKPMRFCLFCFAYLDFKLF